MNVKEAVRNYITNVIKSGSDSMKVLILDDATLLVVNSVYSMSEIMKHDIYLCEKIQSKKENMPYLDCICFMRPTLENVTLLEAELKNPHYKSYNLHFSHTIAKQHLKILAEADLYELVQNVQESFADFIPLDAYLFDLNLQTVMNNREWEVRSLHRTVEGIISLLLSLKMCPQIRYQNNSEATRRLAEQLKTHISREANLFDFKANRPSVIILMDRRLDPVTPLLHQWTYQAMINELLQYRNNCVFLTESDVKEVNLNADHDDFYRDNLHKNFGEICSNIKLLMEDLQVKSKSQGQLDTIDDMKKFIETYPSFKKLSAKVSQHVTIISEISRIISANKLLSISECEQNMVSCQDNHNSCVQMIKSLLGSSEVKKFDALKLVLLYAIRFDRHPRKETSNLMSLLIKQSGVSENEIQLIRMVIDYASIKSADLFREKTNSFGIPSNIIKTIKGVQNIYTQHQPLVSTLAEQVNQGRLKESAFPHIGSGAEGQRVTDCIVFVIGGITFEEALAVHSVNQQIPGFNIVLGGTRVLNSKSFLSEVTSWCGESKFFD